MNLSHAKSGKLHCCNFSQIFDDFMIYYKILNTDMTFKNIESKIKALESINNRIKYLNNHDKTQWLSPDQTNIKNAQIAALRKSSKSKIENRYILQIIYLL